MTLCESCRLGNVDVGDKECAGCRVSELCLEIEALSGALCDLNAGCLDLEKRLALAMRVVDAARAYWGDGPGTSGEVIDAISALDAAQSEEGK